MGDPFFEGEFWNGLEGSTTWAKFDHIYHVLATNTPGVLSLSIMDDNALAIYESDRSKALIWRGNEQVEEDIQANDPTTYGDSFDYVKNGVHGFAFWEGQERMDRVSAAYGDRQLTGIKLGYKNYKSEPKTALIIIETLESSPLGMNKRTLARILGLLLLLHKRSSRKNLIARLRSQRTIICGRWRHMICRKKRQGCGGPDSNRRTHFGNRS